MILKALLTMCVLLYFGTDGEVITEPSDEEWERYTKEAADFQDELKRLKDSANLEGRYKRRTSC